MIAIKYGSGFMSSKLHGNTLWYSGFYHISYSRPSEIMRELTKKSRLSTSFPPGFIIIDYRLSSLIGEN